MANEIEWIIYISCGFKRSYCSGRVFSAFLVISYVWQGEKHEKGENIYNCCHCFRCFCGGKQEVKPEPVSAAAILSVAAPKATPEVQRYNASKVTLFGELPGEKIFMQTIFNGP
jgi:hypothetical protein